MNQGSSFTDPGWMTPVVIIALILILGVFVLIGAALFGLDKGGFVPKLRENDVARGLITYLFAVTTIGVAIVLVVAALTGGDEIEKPFDRGKDILGLLLGVFGTIVGFYFGSGLASTSSRDSYQVTPLRLSREMQTVGGSVGLSAYISGGSPPYQYRVLLGDEPLIEDELLFADGWIDATVSLPGNIPEGRNRLRLEVTDDKRESRTSTAIIGVVASKDD